MNKIIVYSGGADSTLLLYNELMSWKSRDFGLPLIKTISFNSSSFPGSYHQKMRRDKFKKYMFDQYKINFSSQDIEIDNITKQIYAYGMPQQSLWMVLGLFMALDGDEIMFGYIREDDYWHEKDRFARIFDDFKTILGKPNCKYNIPLCYNYKHDIIRDIKRNKLEPYIWICQSTESFNTSEIPLTEMQPCGKCDYCLKWIANEKFLELRGDLSYVNNIGLIDVMPCIKDCAIK